MPSRPRSRWPSVLILLICHPAFALEPTAPQTEVARLHALIDRHWELLLRDSPESATAFGDYRYNDRWTDSSLAGVAKRRSTWQGLLGELEAIDPAALGSEDALNRRLLVAQLRERIEAIDLKLYEMPVNQLQGPQIDLPGLLSVMPFDSVRHYEDYLARLHAVPKVFTDTTGVLRQGRVDGLMPPRYVLGKAVEQTRGIAAASGRQSPFATPLSQFPPSVKTADRRRLSAAILAAIDHEVRPAYARFADFVEHDYAPYGRTEPGYWALPGGDRLYAFLVRQQTTTSMTSDEIFDLGEREVARIEAEMATIAHRRGYPDRAAMRAAIEVDPKLHGHSPEQFLTLYRDYIAGIQKKLPELFATLPRLPLEVRPVEAFREQDAAGAEYMDPTPDGSRPGIVYVNTFGYAKRDTYTIESTAYHEGDPGHHLQGAIALEQTDLPNFRQHGDYGAFVEGWGLYAEQLAKEVGFCQDPYNDYGRLEADLLRAVRLVLDTGVHNKHWSREQMIQYFRAHPAGDEPTIQTETDRYIVSPAQALAYKVGELKLLELRERASTALGAKFDLRAFHDFVLKGGALPLDVLEARVDAWIAAQRPVGTAPGTVNAS